MKIVAAKGLDEKKFKFTDNDAGGGKPSGHKGGYVQKGPKRQRRDSDVGEETDGDDEDHDDGDTRYMHGPGESTLTHQIRHLDDHTLDGIAFCWISPLGEQNEILILKVTLMPENSKKI